ncbi:uncharacterized protein Spindly [Halyomorpha halys]|uniref:uncharacterized protein Spindly n=1 Tax=Halyomorpha halys TaxID=286706 RepID=UPI0006D4E042|nr:protein Spindly [Halyomorpha halys]XP_014273320.1 protein Spindly [Halyomorpha halys]
MECSSISSNNVTFDSQSLQIEELQQQLYRANQQLESGNLINIELEHEIDRLQAIIDVKDNDGKMRKAELTKQFNEKMNNLKCQFEEEREKANNEIADLKHKIECTKANVVKADVCSEEETLKDLVTSLKDELKELKEELAECKTINHNIELTNSQLAIKSKELEETLDITKEMLKSKTETLMSTIEAFEELKEEKALMSSELAILKAGPLENKERGNSLFSEVDIKRQAIEKKMEILRNKYLQAKKILAVKNNEMERLKAENRKIQMFWDEEVSNVKQREQKLLESYKQTNEELRSLIHKLELRPESPEIITISDKDMSNMQWIHTIIDKARAESRDLRKAYENKACDMLLVEENLYGMSIEIKNLKKQAIKDKAQIDELQSKLNAFENPDNTIIPEEKGDSINKKDDLKDQEKKLAANGAISSKTVRFAEDFKKSLALT